MQTLIWLGVAACTQAPPAPPGGDTLVIAVNADIGSLNSLTYTAALDQNVLIPLTVPTIEPRFDCEAIGEPGYAESWTWSEDGKVLTLKLRTDLTWEDGAPVTVDDLLFTFELLADKAVASPRMSLTERIERIERRDERHVAFHFDAAFDRATQLGYVGDIALLPKHVYETADRSQLAAHPASRRPLSYGPFRLGQWDAGQQLSVVRNERFTGPSELAPHLDRVIWRVLPDYATRLLELENGTIDLMESVLVSDADRLRTTHPTLRQARRGWRATHYLVWNTTKPMFSDPAVRRALAEAADVDGLIAKLFTSSTGEAYARRAVGTLTPALCHAYNDALVPIRYDATAARQHLQAAGWRDTDRDGRLDRNGEPLAFTLSVIAENEAMYAAAQSLQANFRTIGVEVQIDRVPRATLLPRLREHDFDAAIGGWSASLLVDPSSLWKCASPEHPVPLNYPGFCDPEVDKLIDRGLSTPLAADAAPIWREVQARIFEQQPYLFLYWVDDLVAVSDRFQDTSIDLLAPYGRLYDWSVPPDRVKYR